MLSCIETLTAKKPKLNAFFPGFCPFGPVIVSIEAAALPPTWRHGHNANQTNQIVQLTPNWHFIWKRLEIGHIFGQPPHHHIFTNPTKNLFYPIHEILFKPASVALPFELSQRVPFSWTLTWQQCWTFKLHNCTKSSDILESFGSWNVFGRNQIAKTKLGKEKRGTWTQKVWMQLNSWQQGQWKEIWSKHQTKMLPGHKNGALFGYVSVFWPSLSEKGLCGPYVLGAALVHLMNPALWTMIARLGGFVPTTAKANLHKPAPAWFAFHVSKRIFKSNTQIRITHLQSPISNKRTHMYICLLTNLTHQQRQIYKRHALCHRRINKYIKTPY